MRDASIDGVQVQPVSAEQLDSYRHAQEQIRAFPTPRLFDTADPHAYVFFALFDGTSNHARKDPEHMTNIGLLAQQLDQLGQRHERIGVFYKEGPGTQGGLTGLIDKATGGTYSERIEAVYDKFSIQAARWIKDDPLAVISVIAVGFSRGAEQAAGFSRLVEARGVQRPTARVLDTLFGKTEVYYNAPPLRLPGTIPQALGLYDPVGSGEPRRHDRRPPQSVLTGLQIHAADEFRALFPATSIISQGQSADGRFLGVSTAGAHSDIGGGYALHGLSHRNFNLMADYLNGVLGAPMIKALALPAAPGMTVVHDAPWYYHKLEGRKVVYSLEATGKKKIEALNPVFGPLYRARSALRHDVDDILAPAIGTPPAAAAAFAPIRLKMALFELDDTRSAAFDSVGRHEEIGRVLHDAAERIREGEVAPFALQDTNGNDVGWFTLPTTTSQAPRLLRAGSVRVEFDLGKPTFGLDPMPQIAQALGTAGDRISALAGEHDFCLFADDGHLLGRVAMALPLPEAQAGQIYEAQLDRATV